MDAAGIFFVKLKWHKKRQRIQDRQGVTAISEEMRSSRLLVIIISFKGEERRSFCLQVSN